MMEKFTAAIVGAGRVGMLWEYTDKLRPKPCTHYGMMKSNNSLQLEAICDLNIGPDGVHYETGYTDDPGELIYWYHNLEDAVKAHSKFDIITIATPTETHFEIGMKAAKHARVLFIEKPITETVDQAKRLIEECKKHGAILMVNHTRRWNGFYREVREWVPDSKFFLGKFTGDWLNVGIHMLDLVNWYNPSSYAIHNLNGVTSGLVFDIEVYGQTTAYILRDNGFEDVRLLLKPSEKYDGISEYVKIAVANPKYYHNPWLKIGENIVNVLQEKEAPLCVGEDGLRALELYYDSQNTLPFIPDSLFYGVNNRV